MFTYDVSLSGTSVNFLKNHIYLLYLLYFAHMLYIYHLLHQGGGYAIRLVRLSVILSGLKKIKKTQPGGFYWVFCGFFLF